MTEPTLAEDAEFLREQARHARACADQLDRERQYVEALDIREQAERFELIAARLLRRRSFDD